MQFKIIKPLAARSLSKSPLVVMFISGSLLLHGCGAASAPPLHPQQVTTQFSVSSSRLAVVGVPFHITLTALDASGNQVPGYSGTVHFTSSDTKAVLPGDSILPFGDSVFSVTFETTGSQTVTATDMAVPSITGSSVSIETSASVEIISGLPPSGAAGKPYGPVHALCCGRGSQNFFQLAANITGYWSWAAAPGSSLPPGLNCCSLRISSNTGVLTIEGVISGIPMAGGAYNVVVSFLASGTTKTATANYTISIANPPPPVVNTTPPPAIGTLNSPYVGFTFSATGLPPYTWSQTGPLPHGMMFSNSGALSGTPTEAGSFPITVTAEDLSHQNSAPQDFTMQVLAKGFIATGSLADSRDLQVAALLTSGKVLITGGINSAAVPLTAELYDPGAGTFAPTKGNMGSARVSATATILKSGKVLIIGGKGADGNPVATAEIYDPVADSFAPISKNMQSTRVYHTATLLNDGTVLVAGGLDVIGNTTGTPVATAEVFDPTTNNFTAVANMGAARFFHTATLLASGKVLLIGGLENGSGLTTAELYDPATKTFSPTMGNMSVGRFRHTATLISGGNVLVAGGASRFGGAATSTAELFDPVATTFTATGTMVTARALHTATLLNDGTVLLAGGDSYFYSGSQGHSLSAAELFDPVKRDFSSTADMTAPRESHTATLLLTGEVLVVGGSNGTLGSATKTTVHATAELYQ